MYEIAVCDDLLPICVEVRQLLSELLFEKDIDFRVHIFTTGRGLLEAKTVFDILLLDIELEKENGLEIARLYPHQRETRIIFLTFHVEEMPNGYKVRAFRFLTKPVKKEEFKEAILAAIDDLKDNKRIIAADEQGEYVVRASEIVYVKAQQRSCGICTMTRFARAGYSLEELEQILDRKQFYSPHRSYIINLDYVDVIGDKELVMKNGERITISRLKRKEFKEIFYKYMRYKTDVR